ncbi:hypothetical protein DFJ43DRAFT_628448 [Lentinula guzmanii]|uniref:Uncharacterized protein n=1 Tax=Lentinula guzmanii TaxID=2804957 RepID=A0AA38N480_9AGAR|nr:hypothetical protein DFJ43DRAFT_628448 [Lentinula guzmanii]
MALGSPSIPEQITDQLVLLSQSLEEIKQRWEQENSEVDNLRTELSQARALNRIFQTRNETLEAQLAGRRSSRARKTLGRILHEDVARVNARLAHAQRHDLISNTDVDIDGNVESEQESGGTSLQTERTRDYDSQPVAVTDSEEEERKVEDMPDDSEYLSPSVQTNPGASLTSPRPFNNRVEAVATGSHDKSPSSSTKRSRVYQEVASVKSASSATLPSEFRPESFTVQPNAPRFTIQIRKPPVSAKVRCGPMKRSHLSKKLNFDEDAAVSLKTLLSNNDLELSLRIQGDYAFVYDPIFLEDTTTSATYLFDWGTLEDNQNTTRYIQEKSAQKDSVFHTFVYILKPRRWYYVGAQKWTQTDLDWDIWETFGEQDHVRSKVIQRLYDHCGNILERETIAEMLSSGELKQICIHLSGDGHIDSSRAMCIAMDYSPPAKSI